MLSLESFRPSDGDDENDSVSKMFYHPFALTVNISMNLQANEQKKKKYDESDL